MKNKRCDHYWFYKHSVWRADRGRAVAVGRICSKCGKMQTATAENWHPLPKSYVDMREKLRRTHDAG